MQYRILSHTYTPANFLYAYFAMKLPYLLTFSAPDNHFFDFCYYELDFFPQIFFKSSYTMCTIWGLAFFTQRHVWELIRVFHVSVVISFYCWVVFHCLGTPQFVFLFTRLLDIGLFRIGRFYIRAQAFCRHRFYFF